MTQTRSWIPARRIEPEFAGRWGLRSSDGRWVDVVYGSEAEAKAAAAVIMRSPKAACPDNDNNSASSSRVS